MNLEQIFRALWRRKWTVLATIVIATVCTYLGSSAVPKVYSASSTLFIGSRQTSPDDFQALQSAQSLTKTYAELIQSENVANRVAAGLPGNPRAGDVLQRVTFQPVSETQLIVITAEDSSAQAAAALANRYASVFIDYARGTNLISQTRSDISLVDPATAQGGPIRPRPLLYSGVMLVVSAFLGVGLALLREQFDRRIEDDDELSERLAAPVLTRVPAVSPRRLAGGRGESFLEAFRVLRVNLAYVSPEDPIRSVLVTSAEPGDGKTTVAVALARVLAEQGQSVLIVEGDLRRPALSEALDFKGSSSRGLAEYLDGDGQLAELVYQTTLENVWLMPAGAHISSPASILDLASLQELIQAGLSWVDFLIVDSPPLSAGADSSILARAAGDVLFVVNAQRTKSNRAASAVRRLRQAGGRVAGLVVNGAPDSGEDGYYGYADGTRRSRSRLAEELAAPVEH